MSGNFVGRMMWGPHVLLASFSFGNVIVLQLCQLIYPDVNSMRVSKFKGGKGTCGVSVMRG